MRSLRESGKALLELCKVKISLFSTLSAATGYVIAGSDAALPMLAVVSGVFALACGSCALNQYQERATDGLMDRTMNRPIPSGKIEPHAALRLSLFLTGLGLSLILSGGGTGAGALGLLAVIWYNGVYTHLKRMSAFAVIPGALTGALPPAIGWIAGGGAFSDPRLLAFCFFLFMWQVPHFWLLLLHYGEEYEKAGLPSLTRVFTKRQLSRITVQWLFAVAVSCLLVGLYGVIRTPLVQVSLLGTSLWLMWLGLNYGMARESDCRIVFKKINVCVFAVMVMMIADRLDLLPGFLIL